MTISEPDQLGPALPYHAEYFELLDATTSFNMSDIDAMPIADLAKLTRVFMCCKMTPQMIERRAQRFRDFILARLDAEPEFVGFTAWPAKLVRAIIGVDPRLIPGVRVTQGQQVHANERLDVLPNSEAISFEYVNGDDVRAWVTVAPWTQGHQLRPLTIDGVEIMSWNVDVGWPA